MKMSERQGNIIGLFPSVDKQNFTTYSTDMLTKADKQFLKENFTTKDDLTRMEKRQNARFATKKDLQQFRMATKNDLASMEKRVRAATKEDLKDLREQIKDDIDGKLLHQKEAIVKEVGEYISDTIVPMFDERDKKIARLEKHTGLSPLSG